MRTTRREFLKTSVGASTLIASGASLPGFLASTASAACAASDAHILVVVQLTGGNDGLNTVVPYEDDQYRAARPTLRVSKSQVHRLDDTLGLHPSMTALKGLYDEGNLNVVMNVGYPNPNRSHFRSMDIWHTARPEQDDVSTGWLGRVVDKTKDAAYALHLADEPLPLSLHAERVAVPSIADADAFRLADGAGDIADAVGTPRRSASEDLLFVQRTAVAACDNAKRLESIESNELGRGYPGFGLASRLSQIARLIGAGFPTRVYYTSLGGFDTHARQELTHPALLTELSESVGAFYRDLTARGEAQRVLLLTFSEFGRRVGENAGRGTDHGAAAPMILAGPPCRAGIVGGPPDLGNLDAGDVRHALDFRSVYADVLDRWLGVSSRAVLGSTFAPARVVE